MIDACTERFERRLVEEVSGLRVQISQVESSIRQDMTKMGAELRGEMAQLGASLRGEMAVMNSSLREDMTAMGSSLREDAANIRSSLRQDIEPWARISAATSPRAESISSSGVFFSGSDRSSRSAACWP